MLTCYILSAHHQYDFNVEVDKIIKLNPDKIICWCAQETTYEETFREFFDKIGSWLVSNNKIINLITPHLDSVYVRPNILTEKSFGYLPHYLYSIIFDTIDYGNNIIRQSTPYPLNLQFDKLFTCYINNYRTERAMLVDLLSKENLLNRSITTFKYPEKYMWEYHDGSRLFDEEDFQLHTNDYTPNHFPKSFFRAFFDIVPESRYDPGEYFITEKTLKSIMSFKPFIALSATGYQKEYLEKYIGLKPYDELFDYGFDNEETITGRIEGVVSNVKRLSSLPTSDLIYLYRKIVPKLIYNKNQILNVFFDKEKMIPNCLKFLIDGTPHICFTECEPPILSMIKEFNWNKK